MDQAASQSSPKKLKPFLIEINKKKSLFNKEYQGIDSKTTKFSEFKKIGKWTKEEDDLLLNAVHIYGTKNWKFVSNIVHGRNQVQCLHRWTKILQPGLTKGPWSVDEDRKLLEWVRKEGPCKWTTCAECIKGRSGKQCRERWLNTLNPNVKKGGWEAEEDYMIFKMFKMYGSQWSKISLYLPRRTENSIKNRFYSTLRRIAAEKKTGTLNQEGPRKSKCRLQSLLKYLPYALEEKTRYLNERNEERDTQKQENIILIDHELKTKANTEDEKELNLLLNSKENNNESLFSQTPANNILNDNSDRVDEQMGILENDINNFIDSFFELNSNDKDFNSSLFVNENNESEETGNFYNNVIINANINESSKLNTLVNELSTLEDLLYDTKQHILAKNPNIIEF